MVEKTPFKTVVKKIKHIGINLCTNLIPGKLCKSHTRKNLKSSQETQIDINKETFPILG